MFVSNFQVSIAVLTVNHSTCIEKNGKFNAVQDKAQNTYIVLYYKLKMGPYKLHMVKNMLVLCTGLQLCTL